MAEPPPRDPPPDELPPEDVPPRDPAEDETIIADDWGAEAPVFVEQTQEELVEPPPPRLPTIWPWLLALLLLVLAGLAAAYFLTRDDDEQAATSAPTTVATTTATTTAAETVSVPDVVGTTSSEATETLRNAGLEVNLVSVPSDRSPGTVVAQSPAAGTEHPKGTSVRLTVAEAAGTTTGATTETETTGTSTPSTTTAPTTTTAPAPPQTATVPDVVGDELADAARSFADEGLKVAVAYVPSSEAAGRVVAQAQPPGTERKRGDTVQLNVSEGANPEAAASVPGVVGQQLDKARSALDQAGFEVLALTVSDREIENERSVVSQSPGAGASVPRGSLVLVYV
jgi:eukaryotic-like serine/threonine-protein kinase